MGYGFPGGGKDLPKTGPVIQRVRGGQACCHFYFSKELAEGLA